MIWKCFKTSGIYQAIDVPLTIPSSYPLPIHRLQFRLFFTGQTDLWVDYIELIPEDLL